MRVCVIDGCNHAVHGRGLCLSHYARARKLGVLSQYPLPDMPETCEPIVPNPPHYRPWRCHRDADQVVRDGGQVKAWSSWQPMHAAMQTLEARDAARDARDAERFAVAFVDELGALVMWVAD